MRTLAVWTILIFVLSPGVSAQTKYSEPPTGAASSVTGLPRIDPRGAPAPALTSNGPTVTAPALPSSAPGIAPLPSLKNAPSKANKKSTDDPDAIADCMQLWDKATHMTKQEWAVTCRRIQSRRDSFPSATVVSRAGGAVRLDAPAAKNDSVVPNVVEVGAVKPTSPKLSAPTRAATQVAIQVNQNDKAVMDLALNNAKNVVDYYKAKGETVAVEIVTYGPGLHMLRADTSPVKERIAPMSLENSNIAFIACGNTQANQSKAEGKPIELISEANVISSGVVRLMELQTQGYAYIRP